MHKASFLTKEAFFVYIAKKTKKQPKMAKIIKYVFTALYGKK